LACDVRTVLEVRICIGGRPGDPRDEAWRGKEIPITGAMRVCSVA
jgi:hypothetical protein